MYLELCIRYLGSCILSLVSYLLSPHSCILYPVSDILYVFFFLCPVSCIVHPVAVAVKEGLQYFEFGLPDGPLVLTTEAAITGLIIGITVTIFSSLLPARKASQVSPMEAIRDSVSTPKRKSLVLRLLVGSLVGGHSLTPRTGERYSLRSRYVRSRGRSQH